MGNLQTGVFHMTRASFIWQGDFRGYSMLTIFIISTSFRPHHINTKLVQRHICNKRGRFWLPGFQILEVFASEVISWELFLSASVSTHAWSLLSLIAEPVLDIRIWGVYHHYKKRLDITDFGWFHFGTSPVVEVISGNEENKPGILIICL